MSRMLNFAEGLLGMGRVAQQHGRVRDALSILSRLSRFRELPRGVAEETQARLGEINLGRKKFTRACRHLSVALRYDGDNARYHHLLAQALHSQGEDHWPRAEEHYRRALELDPDQVDSLTEYGLLCVRMGKADEGLALLRRAVEASPHDPQVLGKLVKGLRWAGRTEECRSVVRCAMFRNAHDRRFQQVWTNVQFRMLRREQQKAREGGSRTMADGPVLLPFVRIAHHSEEPRQAS